VITSNGSELISDVFSGDAVAYVIADM